jgi:two-component system LytT family sensor kinase
MPLRQQIVSLANAVREVARRRSYLLWGAFWTLLMLSESLSSILSARSQGLDRSWQRALAWNVPQFYLWMLLAPCISSLGRRTSHSSWVRILSVHVPLSFVIAAGQTSAMLAIFWQLHGGEPLKASSFARYAQLEFIYQFHLGLIIYWLIFVVVRGLESRRHLRDEKLRTAQLHGELAQAQLQALRVQLQPHFLFNTLNAISALALTDPPLARMMIARLSDLLRFSLEENRALRVPLQRELRFLECYLAIQQVRFQERLIVERDIAEDVQEALVPPLILQPLVENSLQHGLLPVSGGGTLRILIKRIGTELQLIVEDDGQGLPLVALREGVGLSNTRARLAALGPGSLLLRPRNGGGTCAEVRLPYEVAISS